jgi:hypothetical protein
MSIANVVSVSAQKRTIKILDDINQIIMNLKSSYLAAADVWAHMDIR